MRKVADAGLDDRWEPGDVPTDVKEGDRMMQHALRAKQPPPPRNNNLLEAKMTENVEMTTVGLNQDDVEMITDELNQEQTELETRTGVADKGKGWMPIYRSRIMRNVLRDMKALSEELNRAFPYNRRKKDKVVKGTIEEMNRPRTSRGELSVTVGDLVGTRTKKVQGEVSSQPTVNPGDVADKSPPERLADAFEEETAAIQHDYYRAQSSGGETPSEESIKATLKEVLIYGIKNPRDAKDRDEELEVASKEQSKSHKSDKVAVMDFADRAENKAAYHKAKAAEEAGPDNNQVQDPDLRHFDRSLEAQESLRRSQERKQEEEERISDERKLKRRSEGGNSKGKSEGARSKQPPVRSLIPPEPLVPSEPEVTAGPSVSGKSPAPVDSGTTCGPRRPVDPGVSCGPSVPAEPDASVVPEAPAEPGDTNIHPVPPGTEAPVEPVGVANNPVPPEPEAPIVPGAPDLPGDTINNPVPLEIEATVGPEKTGEPVQIDDSDSDREMRRNKWLCC